MRAEEKGFQLLLSAVALQLFSEREKASQVIQVGRDIDGCLDRSQAF